MSAFVNLMWTCFAVARLILLYSPDLHKLQIYLNFSHHLSSDTFIISLINLILVVPEILYD